MKFIWGILLALILVISFFCKQKYYGSGIKWVRISKPEFFTNNKLHTQIRILYIASTAFSTVDWCALTLSVVISGGTARLSQSFWSVSDGGHCVYDENI